MVDVTRGDRERHLRHASLSLARVISWTIIHKHVKRCIVRVRFRNDAESSRARRLLNLVEELAGAYRQSPSDKDYACPVFSGAPQNKLSKAKDKRLFLSEP